MIRFAIEALVTIVGSVLVWWLIGSVYYFGIAAAAAALTLALALTSRARRSTISDLTFETPATPIEIRLMLIVGVPLLVGLFWPVLQPMLAWRSASASARAGEGARGETSSTLQTGEPGLSRVEDAQDGQHRDQP